ncbi:MAG: ATP-binding cassette domain-containing protein [Rhodospirillales bacterium]|nr:ATP-binding cassette domain-containing protein [Rhodospirillales bacterium]
MLKQNPLITLANVAKSFGAVRALDGVDLSIATGDSLVLIGGSGSGKTLMLKCIMGLIKHDSGTIQVDGNDITTLSVAEHDAFLNRFGMTFQKSGLFDSMLTWENVAFQFLQTGMDRSQAKERAIAKLAAVGLEAATADLYPNELSGGMKKRVGLARAIATDPTILFLDEPTAGLDPIMTNVINQLILKVVDDLGATVVSITSDMSSLKIISNRVAMIHGGRIIWDGLTSNVEDSGNPYVDQFVHSRAEGPIKMAVRAF